MVAHKGNVNVPMNNILKFLVYMDNLFYKLLSKLVLLLSQIIYFKCILNQRLIAFFFLSRICLVMDRMAVSRVAR